MQIYTCGAPLSLLKLEYGFEEVEYVLKRRVESLARRSIVARCGLRRREQA